MPQSDEGVFIVQPKDHRGREGLMGKNLFVGNLPFSVEENQLQQIFAEIGEVDSVKIIRDRFSGKSRGFGFVEMVTDDAALEAIKKLNGYSLQGRTIRVDDAKSQKQQPRTQK